MTMEHKRLRIHLKGVEEERGIVEAFTAVFGNVDYQGDIIDPGAFTKTLQERQGDIQVLDNHNTRSCRDVVGKIVEAKEVGVDALPSAVKERYPDATGGLLVKIQFLMDTEEGAGIFKRIKSEAVRQYSIGYDPIVTKRDTLSLGDDEEMTVRRLKELRLWEVSPVIFGANSATNTVSAKGLDPAEEKPWDVFKEDGEYCIYKINEEGEKIGDAEGCHESRGDADDQLAALYASEDATKEMSLGERMDAVWSAFMEQYDLYVGGVYETYLIAEDTDRTAYRVPYTMDEDGEVSISQQSEWTAGRVQFVPDTESTETMSAAGAEAGEEVAPRGAKDLFLTAFLGALEEMGWHIIEEENIANEPTVQAAVARAIMRTAREKNDGDAIGVAISRFLALSADTKEAGPLTETPTSEEEPPETVEDDFKLYERELSELKEFEL